ncbi:protein hunchback [Lucilia sericata]|uniref:protein hunchback n=1 Tax=Lucilia sericata TaxID=13632 RepID=UPI0018A7E832|nr:protein hunchback [Lucilia sericata]
MQNWDTMQTTANYVEHNNWYNNMFAANIKTEPGTLSPTPQTQTQQHSPAPSSASSSTHLENYLKQQQQFSAMDTNMTSSPTQNSQHHLASSSSSNNNSEQQFFDTAGMHQQLMQQQQYQQHFQQAQQAAAQNQVTSHLPLGFNPLTPPGLPQAVLPAMSHFYTQSTQQQRQQQQTPSPQPLTASLLDNSEKSALTPRHTPPMDITPPKSPKASNSLNLNEHHQQDQELMSNSSEDLKYIVDSDDDETIRLPIYNSHGKMKNYKCKSCGMVAITKLAFWEHAKTHMKPEKVLQCPKCPFVTELKHHLEYHIRKHKNLKPFQCDKCSYSCVNKSMLNSHRKSHSSVYQYRCADCDYATKYCHSFKLHLRKYDHKPGMVLDEEGIPNPSVVIDVYGTRRGPKNKGSSGSNLKKSNTELKMPSTSQLSAALQGFPLNTQNNMPASPAKSSSSVASELPALTLNMSLQQQQQAQPVANSQISPSQQSQASSQNGNLPNLLPPLASLLQQNRNMAFFPYWNLNLQMLAAQQQAAVLAQLSPRMREQLQKQQQEQNNEQQQPVQEIEDLEGDDDEEEEEDQEFDGKSVDSAMDLSQGTPTKEDQQPQQTPEFAMNLKLAEDNVETPLFSSSAAARRKGRVLKLDHEQLKSQQLHSAPTSPQAVSAPEMPNASSPIAASAPPTKIDDHSSADESMETGHNTHNNPSNTSSTSTASSSGNSSNSSSTASSSASTTANSSPSATPTMYECKYCDIFFKDAVLYTIHMGYHSCDDVFKCNMCGEKCDGPVGLFVHMARNAHS